MTEDNFRGNVVQSIPGEGETLEFCGVTKSYGAVKAVVSFSYELPTNKVVGIVGPNGSGKTTLINVASGVVAPDAGRVLLGGYSVAGRSVHSVAGHGISRIFQEPRIFRTLLARQAVEVAVATSFQRRLSSIVEGFGGIFGRGRRRSAMAVKMLNMYGLGPAKDVASSELSFGQRRLLGLVCAFATEPRIILLDEPTSGLSPMYSRRMVDQLREFASGRGRSVLIVEHNFEFLRAVCDQCLVMREGCLEASGSPAEILRAETIRNFFLR